VIDRVVAEPLFDVAACTLGHGQLAVNRIAGRSVVSRASATSPLRLQTPSNHGHAAWVYTSSYGGGLVDGDRIALHVDVGDGASAFISSQASTKIYRSPRGTLAELDAHLGSGALLVVAPDPVVCFAKSRYRQLHQFNLADGAALLAIDWVSSGRREAGERWAFEEYVGQTAVRMNRKLLVYDRLVLRAADGDLAERLGRFDVLAVVALVGTMLAPHAASIVSEISGRPVARRAGELIAAAPLGDAGCILRIAGMSVESVGRTIRGLLGFLPTLLGDDPWSRKW
jgi:urease accessory protein